VHIHALPPGCTASAQVKKMGEQGEGGTVGKGEK
jgi:hypothetical protein